MKRLSSVLLVLGLSLFMVSAMWGQFTVNVVATDGVMTDTLILGSAVGATFGVDPGQGEVEQPVVPIAGVFDVRSGDWGTHTGHGQGLLKDLRAFRRSNQTDTFAVTWQLTTENTTGNKLHLSWPSGLGGVGGGYFHILDAFGGNSLDIDMTLAKTDTLLPVAFNSLYIVFGQNVYYQTASYFRIAHETDGKLKIHGATKADPKKNPNLRPNIVTIGTQLDKATYPLTGYTMGNDAVRAVFLKKFGDVLKSSIDTKSGLMHTQLRSCLDSTDLKYKGKPVATDSVRKYIGKKPLTAMVPNAKVFQNNALFAELMVTKFNIKLNDATYLGKAGTTRPSDYIVAKSDGHFNLLIINDTVGGALANWNGQTVQTLVNAADSVLSCSKPSAFPAEPGLPTLTEYRNALKKVNASFTKAAVDTGILTTSPAHLDTAEGSYWNGKAPKTWDKINRIKGIPVASVGYLVTALPAVAGGNSVPQTVSAATQPKEYSLAQNYPNPFNPTTEIKFNLIDKGFVTVKIFNMLGQEVTTLANQEEMASGENSVIFDANNFASGAYFYRIAVNDAAGSLKFQAVKKMMLVK